MSVRRAIAPLLAAAFTTCSCTVLAQPVSGQPLPPIVRRPPPSLADPSGPVETIPEAGSSPTARPNRTAPPPQTPPSPQSMQAEAPIGTLPPASEPATTGGPERSAGRPSRPRVEREEEFDGPFQDRFRWGISPFGGTMLGVGSGVGAGGIDLRLGVQKTRVFGYYFQPVFLFGAARTGSSYAMLISAGAGILADFTFNDHFFIAVGPELLGAAGTNTADIVPTGTTVGTKKKTAYPTFSVAARFGVRLGPVHPDKRHAFMIGFDLRTLTVPGNALVFPSLAIGYESF